MWEILETSNNVLVSKSVSYLDMLALEKNARIVLTDSGGVPKESCFFRVPSVSLDKYAPWPELVDIGWNIVAEVSEDGILEAMNGFQPGDAPGATFGDGRACEKIVDAVGIQRASPITVRDSNG